MDLQRLTAVGLAPLQAETYALLIERGSVQPAALASALKTTRTNSYKLLDKLAELGLASKTSQGKKLAYTANNPMALAAMTAKYRDEATNREEAARNVMQELLATYHQQTDKPDVAVFTGRQEVAKAYRQQANLREDVYYIRTPADISMMGFDTLHDIRTTPARFGNQRHALMPIKPTAKLNYEQHHRSNLATTWIDAKDYSAPVEWSVTTSSLLIILYATEPHAIFIQDSVVSGAFLQLWQLLNSFLQQAPTHQNSKKTKL
jgi:predicted transcriptional regulator